MFHLYPIYQLMYSNLCKKQFVKRGHIFNSIQRTEKMEDQLLQEMQEMLAHLSKLEQDNQDIQELMKTQKKDLEHQIRKVEEVILKQLKIQQSLAAQNEQIEAAAKRLNDQYTQLQSQVNLQVGYVNTDVDNMSYEQLLQLQQKIGVVSKGFTEEQIKNISQKCFQNKEALQIQCTICRQGLKLSEMLISLKCEHKYHSQCILQWLKKQKVCPLCKKDAI